MNCFIAICHLPFATSVFSFLSWPNYLLLETAVFLRALRLEINGQSHQGYFLSGSKRRRLACFSRLTKNSTSFKGWRASSYCHH
ncbi:hypothetical protein V6N13_097140 [Hibiscus sabdariffa]|uniref:Secreted protein n=1 Tax=Hibiscus sabdariffa TaxID=183260 RepID=A0ABR2BYJ4_9ROSI